MLGLVPRPTYVLLQFHAVLLGAVPALLEDALVIERLLEPAAVTP